MNKEIYWKLLENDDYVISRYKYLLAGEIMLSNVYDNNNALVTMIVYSEKDGVACCLW